MKTAPPLLRPAAGIALVVGALLPGAAPAQIRTDGSLGRPAQALAGPGFLIPETLGHLAGGNLFHSFQSFNLAPGESARFTTATPGIAHVIGRVTGGTASVIQGRIALQAASGAPSLTLINPAGIAFGQGAGIDVPGAFHAGTADHVSFADGSRYAANPAAASSFSTAAPAAFGFLGGQRARLSLDSGATLVARPGQTVALAGGDVLIEQAGVYADGGDIRLASTGTRAQEVPFSGKAAQGAGSVMIVDGGIASVSTSASNRGGSLRVQAGDLVIDGLDNPNGAGLYGRALGGSGSGARIEIDASGSLTLRNGGVIRTDTRTAAPGGTTSIASPVVSIDNAYINADAYGAGRAGNIEIDARRIVLAHGGQIAATAQDKGPAGRIVLTASESIDLSGRDANNFHSGLFVSTMGKAPAGEIELGAPRIVIRDDAWVRGFALGGSTAATAGHIRISAVDLLLENGGKISVEGYDSMGQGSVLIEAAGSLRIHGKGEGRGPNPGSDTVSTGILGHGADIRIRAPEITVGESGAIRSESWYQDVPGRIEIGTQRLTLQSGGHISGSALGHSYTYGIGAPIVIEAGEFVRVEGRSSEGRDSIIESGARSSGGSGSIRIATPWLRLADGGRINTSTGVFGTAKAGRIEIEVDRLEILNDSYILSIESGHAVGGGLIAIAARESILLDGGLIDAEGRNDAGGGNIVIAAPSIRLRSGTISTANDQDALPGGIKIDAGQLSLANASRIESSSTSRYGAGSIALRIGGTLRVDDSAITTTSAYAGGGNIAVDAAGAVVLGRSLIATSVTGEGATGNGGDIALRARALALDNGFIQANTVARDAQGGAIRIDAGLLVASGNHLLLGGRTPYAFQPGVPGFNVIQAAAPTGVSGAIDIATPALDLSGSVLALSAETLDPGGLGRSPCQPSGGSSLVQVGRGGFAPSARGVLGPRPAVAPDIRPDAADAAPSIAKAPCAGLP